MGTSNDDFMGDYVSGVPHSSPKEMRIWMVLVMAWMTVLSISAVVLRIFSRRLRKMALWWDDYLILVSMIWNWVVVGIGSAMFFQGAGYHAWQLSPSTSERISMWLLVTEMIYVWNLCITKISLLLMYYRIFHHAFFKKCAIAVGCFVIACAVTTMFLFIFICVPVEKLWKPELPGHCISELGVWMTNSATCIFSDILILVLPMPQVWNLRLKTMEKVGAITVFSLGFFVVFASSFRTWVLFNYSKDDVPYTIAPILIWSDIEMCAGIISACLPTLLPVVALVSKKLGITSRLQKIRGSSAESSKRRQAYGTQGSRSAERTIGRSANDSRYRESGVGPTEVARRWEEDEFFRLPDSSKDGIYMEEIDIGSDGGSEGRTSRKGPPTTPLPCV